MSSKPSEKRQVVRFAFYKLDSAWRRLSAERQASSKIEFGEIIESFAGRLLLRPYGLVGIRGDCDFLLWQVAERSEEHTSELQSRLHLVCRLLLEKKKTNFLASSGSIEHTSSNRTQGTV